MSFYYSTEKVVKVYNPFNCTGAVRKIKLEQNQELIGYAVNLPVLTKVLNISKALASS